jgi:amidase
MDGEWPERHLTINGRQTAFGDQLVWPGMATLANLPATSVPIGVDSLGLPIGIQVIGPFLEDHTTIAFSGLIARL